MMKKQTNTKVIYPYSEWELVEEKFLPENNYRNETMFSLGNGYIGFRGNFEEGYKGPAGTGLEGTYINGFYETETVKYPEIAYGFPEKSQTMLNVTNSKSIKLFIEDEEFSMLEGTVKEYSRVLSLKEGVLTRTLVWCSPKGRIAKIKIERLVSLKNKHVAAIEYEIIPVNFDGKVVLISALDGDVTNLTADNDPRVGSGLTGRVLNVKDKWAQGDSGGIVQGTVHSKLTLACAMENRLQTQCKFTSESIEKEFSVATEYTIEAKRREGIKLTKYIAYTTSWDFAETELPGVTANIAANAAKSSFGSMKKEQADSLREFWFTSDVEIKGDIALQQGIRVNIFHLLQSVGRDGKTNIGAKGLTGEGYEGHYFWDTETYILPFFIYNNPEISRKLLEYRYLTLDKARERARQMAHKRGALFPWRTINGEECSTYFPAGTAQYHIDADVAFAVKRYMEATEDDEFLVNFGAEILIETARLWADLGEFIPHKGNKFCINCVTGPDEYTAIVNNNCYTNLMAEENLLYACKVVKWMKESKTEEYHMLAEKIGLEDSELEFWQEAADKMYIPYDEEMQIYLQDDAFLDRAPWDFKNTPEDNYPLLLHYHPLVIYRHQVCKQADLILGMFFLSNRFSLEEKKRSYDYYEGITTHDSSLSTAIFSVMASEIGYHEKAYSYFMGTARMDLDDSHGNTKDGIHAANMAGTWMCIVNGFAGMRVFEDVLHFTPYLPENWEEYSFKIGYKGRLVKITVNKGGTEYELLRGDALTITHNGVQKTLEMQ